MCGLTWEAEEKALGGEEAPMFDTEKKFLRSKGPRGLLAVEESAWCRLLRFGLDESIEKSISVRALRFLLVR